MWGGGGGVWGGGGGGVKHTIYQLSQVGSIGVWNLEMDFSVGEDVVLSRLLSDQTRSLVKNWVQSNWIILQ